VVVVKLPGGEKACALRPHSDRTQALASAPNGLLASGGRDGLVVLWDWDGRSLHERARLWHDRPVRGLAFRADGVGLAVLLDAERAVRYWRLDALRQRLEGLGLGGGLESIRAVPLPEAAPPLPPAKVPVERPKGPQGLRAELFAGRNLHRLVKVRRDALIDRTSRRHPLDPLLAADEDFTTRWTGWLKAPAPGRYVLGLDAARGCRLWLDGELCLVGWRPRPPMYRLRIEVELTDRPHALRVEHLGTAPYAGNFIRLLWERPGAFQEQLVAPRFLFAERAAAEKARPEAPK
jgi:hypothetical protein